MQAGDVERTRASTQALFDYVSYEPKVSIKEGVHQFVDLFHAYSKQNKNIAS